MGLGGEESGLAALDGDGKVRLLRVAYLFGVGVVKERDVGREGKPLKERERRIT